ncbi:MAG: acyl-CoA dehydrogenase [Candidatus Schekmanbacteria bacterium]|nr:acyl-CoA dehydrogenase [Candidatus Schekmanbacteria bacterium]
MSASELAPGPLTSLSEEEELLRNTVREFAQTVIAPRAADMDRVAKMDPEIIEQCFELGLMGIEVPEELGGAGSSFFMAILVIEELAAVDPSVAVLVDVQNTLVNNALLRWGTASQQAAYLRKLTADTVGAYCLSEAASGSDAFALQTRALEDGAGYRLNGRKLWITNGNEAGVYLIFATVDPALGYRGITGFIVERGFSGFSVGKKEDKLGIRASSTVELVLDDCWVPRENVLGEVGKGYKIAIETLNEGRIGIGAQMIGLARGALNHAKGHVLERKQFGKALSEFQGVQFQLAQCATEVEAARLLVYNASRLKDAGLPFLTQAAMAKLFASQTAERCASQAVEFLGGTGFTKDFPVEKLYRDAKIGAIYEGTSNMQLVTIAKQLLARDVVI